MTPLVDVMLVLLIIFIITAPLMTHSVSVNLPTATSTPTSAEPSALQVSINAAGDILVDSEMVSLGALQSLFKDAVQQDSKVALHIEADKAVRYESVAETMALARRSGIAQIAFVTTPNR